MASTTTARWSTPTHTARCSMPSPALSDEAQQLSGLYRIWRDTERTLKKHREKVENAAREADYLRASVEELDKLSPQDGEEDELAERRSRMMKAERIAGDISEASELSERQCLAGAAHRLAGAPP